MGAVGLTDGSVGLDACGFRSCGCARDGRRPVTLLRGHRWFWGGRERGRGRCRGRGRGRGRGVGGTERRCVVSLISKALQSRVFNFLTSGVSWAHALLFCFCFMMVVFLCAVSVIAVVVSDNILYYYL